MNYFKLIDGKNIVGIATDDNLRKFQKNIKTMLFSDIDTAQYIEVNDVYYRDSWLKPVVTDLIEYIEVTIIVISKEEYDALRDAFKTEDTIQIMEKQEEQEVSSDNDEVSEITLDFVKDNKIKELSYECEQTIINGIVLKDEEDKEHRFSLTIEDQIKIQSMYIKAITDPAAEPKDFLWHSDDEETRIYSKQDVLAIYNAMMQLIDYQTAYFNSLKNYVKSLDNIEAVFSITYGCEIPEEYQSEALKYLVWGVRHVG